MQFLKDDSAKVIGALYAPTNDIASVLELAKEYCMSQTFYDTPRIEIHIIKKFTQFADEHKVSRYFDDHHVSLVKSPEGIPFYVQRCNAFTPSDEHRQLIAQQHKNI